MATQVKFLNELVQRMVKVCPNGCLVFKGDREIVLRKRWRKAVRAGVWHNLFIPQTADAAMRLYGQRRDRAVAERAKRY